MTKEEVEEGEEGEEVEEELYEDVVLTKRIPDCKLRVQLKRHVLRHPLGRYQGLRGPIVVNQADLFNDSALDYLLVLWPEFLVDVIVHARPR